MPQQIVICANCPNSFNKPISYKGKNPLLCHYCRRRNTLDNQIIPRCNHFLCSGCSVAVNFQEQTIPEYYLIGIRPFCDYCKQYYYTRPFNQFCGLCCLPHTSNYVGNAPLCPKCRIGCTVCGTRNNLVFGISFRKLAKNYNFTPRCYCRSCYDAANILD